MRRNLWTALAAGAAIAVGCGLAAQAAEPAAKPAFGRYEPRRLFAHSVTTSQYVAMRDGVRIAVSVTRPANAQGVSAPGKFPVLWTGTLGIPANGPEGPVANAPRGYRTMPEMAQYGYVVVQVARRANGPSFGRRRGYNDRTESYDSDELIDWMAAQPWSTGNVGVWGCSNTGDAAMHAVTMDNPHLKAAWAGCFSFEKYDGFLRGGIFANWGTGPERSLDEDMRNTPVQGDEAKTLLRRAAEEHQGAPPLAAMWRGMPFRDSWTDATQSRFWYEGSVATYLPQVQRSGTAIYVQGGWRDDLRAQGLVAYANIPQERHIVIGPWGHCENGDFDLFSEVHRFFDQQLKGIDTGVRRDDPIHYFTVNAPAGKEWRSAKAWPIAGAQATRYFLAGGAGGPALASAAGGASTPFTVTYDVDCPTARPMPGGLLTGAPPCPLAKAGPHFATAPLVRDTEVTGDPVADLWISSSAADANVFVYLEDVGPDGKVTPVTDARLKASLRKVSAPRYKNYGLPWHRGHAEDAEALVPGAAAQMTFAFLPTSYVFKAGHRIQISVAGADYRERDRRTGPGPQMTIVNTAAQPSAVTLPVVR